MAQLNQAYPPMFRDPALFHLDGRTLLIDRYLVKEEANKGRYHFTLTHEACRIEWWREYHKANPPEDEQAKECAMCGAPLSGKHRGQKYCSRFCYLLAVDRGHSEEVCEWCGGKFLDSIGQGRRYCSRNCSVSARYTQQGVRRGKRRISAESLEEWKEKLTQAARAEGAGKRGKRVRLVCGTTSMYTGLDGLMAIVRYHLKLDPCDGSVYVFRDGTGSMLK